MRLVLLFLLFALALAQASSIDLKVKRTVLPNGLTILLHENSQSPTVACRLFYATGSVHEKQGSTGLAHMLEHMLFKGTKKVGIRDSIADARLLSQQDSLQKLLRQARLQRDSLAMRTLQVRHDSLLQEHRKLFVKDELWESYLKAGGTGLNAYTSDMVTAYHVTLPRNKVELFLWLESDRMQNAVLREFYPERDVVREERRLRSDDSPTGRYFESLDGLRYEAFAYRNPTIGYPADIENLTREMAEEHYRKYYKPNNAILVFAGDFRADSLLPLIERYFAPLPRGEEFTPVLMNEPEPAGEKRLLVRRDDAKPRIDLSFPTPGFPHADLYALDILESVLNGRSGRLNRRLVEAEKVAVSASAGNGVRLHLSTFDLRVALSDGKHAEKAEALLWEEIKRLQTEPVSSRELQRVQNELFASKARSLSDMEEVASMLGYYELYGDYTLVNRWMDEVAKVSPAQIQEVAKRYFHRKRSTIGTLLPETR